MTAMSRPGSSRRMILRPKTVTLALVEGKEGKTIAPIREKRRSNSRTSKVSIKNLTSRPIIRSFRDVRPPKRVQQVQLAWITLKRLLSCPGVDNTRQRRHRRRLLSIDTSTAGIVDTGIPTNLRLATGR